MTIKATKSEVHYQIGMAKSHCGKSFKDDEGYCRHYRPNTEYEGTCEKVEGAIKAMYWCRLWSKAPSR
jgi:hypothetical protein